MLKIFVALMVCIISFILIVIIDYKMSKDIYNSPEKIESRLKKNEKYMAIIKNENKSNNFKSKEMCIKLKKAEEKDYNLEKVRKRKNEKTRQNKMDN